LSVLNNSFQKILLTKKYLCYRKIEKSNNSIRSAAVSPFLVHLVTFF
jgi:hypothetical protein